MVSNALPKLRKLGVLQKHPTGRLLFGEGDPATGFWLIEKGAIRLYHLSESGKESEVGRMGPGEIVAAALALAGLPYPHFGQVYEDATLVWIPVHTGLPSIVQDPELAGYFLQVLARKCSDLSKRMSALQMLPLRERFLRYVQKQCPRTGECSYRIPVARKDLALMLGTTPETMSRLVTTLQQEGVMTMDRRNVRILQCPNAGKCAPHP
jgi:CRP/FNR family transcriptional regulator